jgi:hypothetical protein
MCPGHGRPPTARARAAHGQLCCRPIDTALYKGRSQAESSAPCHEERPWGHKPHSCAARAARPFSERRGGGFYFDLLHCESCGKAQDVSHRDLGEIHLGFIKGLPGPYAVARAAMDAEIQARYRGPVLNREEYHAAVEGSLEACACGGRFRYDAPTRCPTCHSTSEQWDRDPSRGKVLYD